MSTSIEWTDETWNPVTGCTKISPGCKHCYAEGIAERFFAKQYPANQDGSPRKFTDVRCHPDRLDQPLHWKKPRRVFVNSMSDLFHEDVPLRFIDSVLEVIGACPQHTFQVLTKRADRLQHALYASTAEAGCRELGGGDYLPNLWLGVSVENQKMADERIPLLRRVPAAVRFLSVEPQLEAINLLSVAPDLHDIKIGAAIDWVIIGGESGPGARPFHLSWAESLLHQCRDSGIPCFIKQLGSKPTIGSAGLRYVPIKDRKGGNMSEWPESLRVREFPRMEAQQQ